jgi:hypothetical protein
MKEVFSQFSEQSEKIRIPPHNRAWDRIESKLSAHRSRRKLVSTRVLSFAAVLLCLVAISAGILLYAQSQREFDAVQYSHSIEELKSVSTSGESIYDIDRIRVYYTVITEH